MLQPEIDPLPPRNVPRNTPRTTPAAGMLTNPRQSGIDLSPPETLPEELPAAAEELPAPQPVVVPETGTSAAVGRPAWIAPPPKPPESLTSQLPSPAETVGGMNGSATHLTFNAVHTGGVNLDGRPGDDGLAILLETLNDQGEFVPQVGKVSVVLLDPALEGADARVARWDFNEDQVRASQSVLAQQRGIALTMPWPTAPPQNSTLRLFVRLETADGQRLQADQELSVSLPGQASNTATRPNRDEPSASAAPAMERWTPRAAGGDYPAGEVARRPGTSAQVLPGNPNQGAPLATPLPGNSNLSSPPNMIALPPATIQEPRNETPTPRAEAKPRMIMPPPALGEPE